MYEQVPVMGGWQAAQRWLVPQSFLRWTATMPERYRVAVPLVPPVLLTCSPADCRAVFTAAEGTLLFGEGLRRFAPHEAMFGHDALDALDGPEHTRQRRLLTGAFHGDALRGYEAGIVAATERALERWPLRTPVKFATLARDLARDVIAATVFGVTERSRAQRLARALDRLDRALGSLELAGRFLAAVVLRGRWAPYPSMRSIHAEIEAVTREEIAARRASGREPGRDCMDHFLYGEPAGGMSDEEIVAALRVLVIAGWATTANTLAWLAERLAHHPDALAACHDDVRAGQGRYLSAAVQETLRMRPPVPATLRYVARELELDGLRVTPGTVIATDIERMHFREDIYEAPRAFRPERFLAGRPGTYTWIPFGGGVHRCIGAGFALTEARLILHTVLSHLTFAPGGERPERSRRTTLITAPARGATVTLVPV